MDSRSMKQAVVIALTATGLAAAHLADGAPAGWTRSAETGPWSDVAAIRLAQPASDLGELAVRIQEAGGTLLLVAGEWAWVDLPREAEPAFATTPGLARRIERAPWPGPYASPIEASAALLLGEIRGNLESAGQPFLPGPPISFPYADGIAGDEERMACGSPPSGDWPPADDRYLGRTHVMQGMVTANFFFVESDASGPENLYSWDGGTVNTVLAKIQAALLWWQSQASARGKQLTFALVTRLPGAPECQVPVEPVAHTWEIVESTVVPDIMSSFGLTGEGRCTTGRFNDAQRGSNDRAFSAFLFTGATSFLDGRTAWAWLNGSYLASVADPAGQGIGSLDRVLAHETAHIFRACDEYAAGCAGCVPCIAGAEPNGNCEDGGGGCGVLGQCVMRNGALSVCSFTADQIGWDEYRAPALLYPAAGQTVLTGQAPLRPRAFGATRYHVQVDDSSGFACPEFDAAVTDTVVLSTMLPEGTYSWRARAADALNAFGPWSATGTFTVDYPASPPAGIPALLTGPGPVACASPTWVRAFDTAGSPLRTSLFAYPGASYGVNVAAGDLDGDGVDEIVAGYGTQDNYGTSVVRVFAADGTPGTSFTSYGNPDYRGGVHVAAGNVDGQGGDEIITGTGPFQGNWPIVRLWRADGTFIGEFNAYPGANQGVNVASGDIDGDGQDEIITGPGPNGSFSPQVSVWRRNPNGSITGVASFNAFNDLNLTYGVNVAAGDIDGDGRDEIIAGPGPNPSYGTSVEMWRVAANGAATRLGRFTAYWDGLGYGVNVGAGDLDGDGRAEIVTGPGPNPNYGPSVRIFRIGPDYTSTHIGGVDAYPIAATGGVNVAVADFNPAAASGGWADAAGGAVGDYREGRGAAWGDYDLDGDPDLYLSNFGANKLFRNDGGVFADATPALLGDTGLGAGAAWGDYDDDGNLDLYLANNAVGNPDRRSKLFRNLGGAAFADATAGPLGYIGQAQSVAWADHDRDGDLDLFLASTNGYNQLYRNDNGGAFADATPALLRDAGASTGVAWGDYDSDGDPDLYLSVASGGTNRLFRNDGGGAFADATSGPLAQPGQGGGPAWGDYDNDGDLDLYLTRIGSNKLLRNDGGGVFADATAGPLGDTGMGTGVAWADFDLDGDLDLYSANFDGPNKLLRNDDGGAFVDATPALLADAGRGQGVAWADYDGDGDLDLYTANFQGPGRLFRNLLASGNHWLQVDLVGLMTNTAAIGARVRVVAGGVAQIREIEGGSGYLSQSSLTAEFGLGAATVADTVSVRWTTGRTDVFHDVAADQRLVIREVLGSPAAVEGGAAPVPTAYRLYDNVPNPFNPATTIGYDLAAPAPVSLRVYDIGGRLVRVLERAERREAGHHQVVWDGRDGAGRPVASGVYFYRHEAGAASQVRRMVLLK